MKSASFRYIKPKKKRRPGVHKKRMNKRNKVKTYFG